MCQGCKDQWMPEAHWLANLAKSMKLGSSERRDPVSKSKGGAQLRLSPTSACSHFCLQVLIIRLKPTICDGWNLKCSLQTLCLHMHSCTYVYTTYPTHI